MQKSKLKIAIVSHNIGKAGGICRCVWELSHYLAPIHDITLVTSNAMEMPQDKRIKLVFLNCIKSPEFLWSFSFAVRIWFYLRRHKFDIVHTHGSVGFKQDVVTAHSCHKAWYRLSLRATKRWTLAWWLKLFNPAHYLTILTETIQYKAKNHKRVIAVAPSVRQELETHYGLSGQAIRTIYNGVDLDKFHPNNKSIFKSVIRQKLKIADNDQVLLFVAHEFRRKGLQYILDALTSLPATYHLVVVGKDSPAAFVSQAETSGIRNRVHFVGATTQVEQYFASADMFVFPTQYEPFGLVILEAMASGLPVITTKVAGVAEVMTDRKNCMLLPRFDDVDALRASIQAIENVDVAKTMGESARKVAESLSWSQHCQKTLDVYEECLGDTRRT